MSVIQKEKNKDILLPNKMLSIATKEERKYIFFTSMLPDPSQK